MKTRNSIVTRTEEADNFQDGSKSVTKASDDDVPDEVTFTHQKKQQKIKSNTIQNTLLERKRRLQELRRVKQGEKTYRKNFVKSDGAETSQNHLDNTADNFDNEDEENSEVEYNADAVYQNHVEADFDEFEIAPEGQFRVSNLLKLAGNIDVHSSSEEEECDSDDCDKVKNEDFESKVEEADDVLPDGYNESDEGYHGSEEQNKQANMNKAIEETMAMLNGGVHNKSLALSTNALSDDQLLAIYPGYGNGDAASAFKRRRGGRSHRRRALLRSKLAPGIGSAQARQLALTRVVVQNAHSSTVNEAAAYHADVFLSERLNLPMPDIKYSKLKANIFVQNDKDNLERRKRIRRCNNNDSQMHIAEKKHARRIEMI